MFIIVSMYEKHYLREFPYNLHKMLDHLDSQCSTFISIIKKTWYEHWDSFRQKQAWLFNWTFKKMIHYRDSCFICSLLEDQMQFSKISVLHLPNLSWVVNGSEDEFLAWNGILAVKSRRKFLTLVPISILDDLEREK